MQSWVWKKKSHKKCNSRDWISITYLIKWSDLNCMPKLIIFSCESLFTPPLICLEKKTKIALFMERGVYSCSPCTCHCHWPSTLSPIIISARKKELHKMRPCPYLVVKFQIYHIEWKSCMHGVLNLDKINN